MIKPLAGVAALLGVVLAVNAIMGQRQTVRALQAKLAEERALRNSQPTPVLAFELEQAGGKKLAAADLCGSEVVLLYLYSDSKRDPAIERDLARIFQQSAGRLRVVPVRDRPSQKPVPPEIAQLGTPVTDTKGVVAAGYKVARVPAVIVLKRRPVYHSALAGDNARGQTLKAVVDWLVARDDLTPTLEGCGGECRGGSGPCAAGAMLHSAGSAACDY